MIAIAPLSRPAFAAFGEVVEMAGGTRIGINQGFADRFNGLATIDVAMQGGVVNISLFEARCRARPIAIAMMERHPLGSQLFYPLQDRPWLVVVCTDPRRPETYRAFHATGRQGVNYARNVWHHPLLVLADTDRFIVVDRGGGSADGGSNLEEVWLDGALQLDPDGVRP